MRTDLASCRVLAYDPQPDRAAEDELLQMPQVIVTPHCGAHTDGAMEAMGWGALPDCLAVLKGEQPLHPVFFQKE